MKKISTGNKTVIFFTTLLWYNCPVKSNCSSLISSFAFFSFSSGFREWYLKIRNGLSAGSCLHCFGRYVISIPGATRKYLCESAPLFVVGVRNEVNLKTVSASQPVPAHRHPERSFQCFSGTFAWKRKWSLKSVISSVLQAHLVSYQVLVFCRVCDEGLGSVNTILTYRGTFSSSSAGSLCGGPLSLLTGE